MSCSSLAHTQVQPDLSNFSRSDVRKYFLNSYELYELIFSAIEDEQYIYKSPDRLRLPLIFYVAHTASVYINKLLLAGLIEERVNATFESVFELGVDEMSWDDTENYRLGGAFKWPSLEEVMKYRKQVSEVVLDVIDNAPLQLPVTMEHPWWALFMGIEHERIHLDTTSVLLTQLPVSMFKRPTVWQYAPLSMGVGAGKNELIKVPAGRVEIGKAADFPSYGWDNEYGHLSVDVPEFQASKYLVTNGEFMDFVEDRGYQREELWTDDGWKWVTFREAKHPTFWVCGNGCKSGCGGELASYSHCTLTTEQLGAHEKYRYRAIFDVIEMPMDWPVVVNYHEMEAFCQWKGPQFRAPTEAEHHRMRGDSFPSLDVRCDPAFNPNYSANMMLKYGSPSPVNMFPPSSTGQCDVYGNVWEWVQDHFNGLPGFKTSYLYDDFSTPFFDNRHNLIVGGCWIATGGMASRFFRNWFRRHFFQNAGFRYVISSQPTPVRLCSPISDTLAQETVTIPNVSKERYYKPTNNQFQYETEQSLQQVLQNEYGSVVSSAVPVLQMVESLLNKYNVPRNAAIVFGSAGGMSTLLLSQHFNTVMGVDFSGRFVSAALSIQQGKEVGYGDGKEATLPDVKGIDTARVTFRQFAWIPNEITEKDLVLFEFADRLNEPKGWLRKLWETITPQGIVVIVTSERVNKQCIQTHMKERFVFLEDYLLPTNQTAVICKLKSPGALSC